MYPRLAPLAECDARELLGRGPHAGRNPKARLKAEHERRHARIRHYPWWRALGFGAKSQFAQSSKIRISFRMPPESGVVEVQSCEVAAHLKRF